MTASAVSEASEKDVPETPARRGLAVRIAPYLAVLAGVAALAWHATLYGHWIVDDAAITFSYARSFADGLGPVLQPGQPSVEGWSNSTWLVLLAVGKLFGVFDSGTLFGLPDYVLFPKLLGLLFTAGTLAACHVAAKQIFERFAWLATLVTGLTLAAIPSFVIWTISGLENSLFGMAVAWLAVLLFVAVRKNTVLTAKVAIWSGVLVAFAALTRPEGLIYGAAYPLVVLFQLRKPLLGQSVKLVVVSVVAFAIPFGAYLAWRIAEFGRLLANPSIAKGQGLPGLSALKQPFELVGYAGVAGTILLALTIGYALVRADWRQAFVALLTPLALGIIAYGVMVPDWMGQHRFATPIWILAALAGTLAAGELLRRSRAALRAVVVLVLVAAAIPSGMGFASSTEKFQQSPTVPACLIADRFGRGFNTMADILGLQQASLLLPDLGGSSMTSRLHLVDMAGLVEADVADFVKKGDMPGLRDYVFDKVKPTFIHSWGPWAAGNGITVDPRIDRDYEPVFVYPGVGLRSGDFVRKDAVSSPEKLKAVQDYAAKTMPEVEKVRFGKPLNDCGPSMHPGQTVYLP
ncbi:hypothetical protein [Amycolatopsis azurea]|uniref:Glycosyltransferase RgtA/B/C/D-like domain-containing protein n=1 Tax=Amycolatopsis azurea DSM 43854 TaxID=1238180 RepID=A0ABX3J029_9PSEU|nr:hypothetical protein [Amycolatopsis azurea]OOC01020.1 hypothetical protein B0293_40180 [Amycolatopsis azurea DSM 43854]